MKIKVLITKEPDCIDLPLPSYATSGAAGMDLRAAVAEPTVLNPGEIKYVRTGLRISLPPNVEAQIRPRSGLALKHGIGLVNSPGTVDSDYRGEIGIIMINFGPAPFTINRGDRIAQMVFSQVAKAELEETETLDETARSSGGFGHTGI